MRARSFCATLVLSALAGCSTDARWNRFSETEPALLQAREFAAVDCQGPDECSLLWTRTKAYVTRYSATHIRYADERAIETARPLEAGVVYLWATRTPSAEKRGWARISVKAMCRGMYAMDGGPGWLYTQCASEIQKVEIRFRGFVLAPERGAQDDAA
ncbi:hypothetical protein [Caballeronia sp. ATUFL_M2_KS44]|uniref:hypothetical protein n=1 Tax=Caballeronia sp. ATUFL_M2_KS44 TaxID=2921767 RepID=UPI00202844B8|nr:hypothetical protein [Caballeronia sp. ATUFL_M2_KS44]